MTTTETPLHWWSAADLARGIRTREISAVDVMRAHLDRIEERNDALNAMVAMIPESEALAAAEEADRAVARGDEVGILHGLPTGVKDLMDAAGLPTTHGMAAHRDAKPATTDSFIVRRVKNAGAIVIGKTNTPEVGLGTLTFNDLHGVCRNPWDTTRHAGGSSGGSAAAVAAGMLPFADGSDSGGSLRYPAAFCNIVGLRPSPGRIASGRADNGWTAHGVLGPMTRTSMDAAFVMAAMAGADPYAPMSIAEDAAQFQGVEPTDASRVRIGWSTDAGGVPIEADVARTHAETRRALVSAGYDVVDLDLAPSLERAEEAWETIEVFNFFGSCREDVAKYPELLRPDLVRNVRQGEALSATQIADAVRIRTAIFRAWERLFDDVDLVVTPATPVVAPPAEVEWVDRVGDVTYDRYFRWQMLANRLTVTAHPVLVTPAGFSNDLPVGMQVVGRHRGERDLLAHAAGIEKVLRHVDRNPQ